MLYLGSVFAGVGAGAVYASVGLAVKCFPDRRESNLLQGLELGGAVGGAAI
jgi:hypothetical protein